MRIYEYFSGELLLSQASDISFDAVILDVYMTGMSGIETARKLRYIGEDFPIILATVSRDHALEAFGIGAVHYLLKPVKHEELQNALDRCRNDKHDTSGGQILKICTECYAVSVRQREIQYIDIQGKKATIHTKYRDYITWVSLQSLKEKLDEGMFIKPQRSFLINMHYISKLKGDRCILKNGMEVSLSRITRNDIKERYNPFLFEIARGRADVFNFFCRLLDTDSAFHLCMFFTVSRSLCIFQESYAYFFLWLFSVCWLQYFPF